MIFATIDVMFTCHPFLNANIYPHSNAITTIPKTYEVQFSLPKATLTASPFLVKKNIRNVAIMATPYVTDSDRKAFALCGVSFVVMLYTMFAITIIPIGQI